MLSLRDSVLRQLAERGVCEEFDSIYNTNQKTLKRMKARSRMAAYKRKRGPRYPRNAV